MALPAYTQRQRKMEHFVSLHIETFIYGREQNATGFQNIAVCIYYTKSGAFKCDLDSITYHYH